jgi:hypothetical integral membrane protein (TIGR02206 family)
VRAGRGKAADPQFYWARLALAATILWASTFWTFFKLLPEHFNPDSAFPLHMCDFAWMAATASLVVSENRRALVHELVFFWGLGLSTQAFVQPTLSDGAQTIDFWLFWIPHWQIVAVGLLNYFAFGFRPTRQGFLRASVVTVILGMVVTCINIMHDTPYCFTGRGTPDNPTVVDFLGPWPWRIPILFVIVIAWFALLTKIFRRKESS